MSEQRVILPDDPRELLIATARDAGFSDAQWKSMFYESGPYDVTFPSFPMKQFAKLLIDALCREAEAPVAWRIWEPRTEIWIFSETAPNDPDPSDRARWEPLYAR